MLQQADFGMRMEAAEEFLQAESVAVGGNRQAGLFLEKGAQIVGRKVHAPGKFGLGKFLRRIGQQSEDSFQLGMEGRAILHGCGGAELVPKRKKSKVEAAVESIRVIEGGDGGQEAVKPLKGRGGQAAAKWPVRIGGARVVAAAGPQQAGQGGRFPFDDPQAHVGRPVGRDVTLTRPEPDKVSRQEGVAAVFQKNLSGAAQHKVDFDGFMGMPLTQVPAFVGQRHDDALAAGLSKKG